MNDEGNAASRNDLPHARTATIHIRLLDEGINVARPTLAVCLSETQYLLLPTKDYDPATEKWEFLPGDVVLAEQQHWSSGEILLAVRLAERFAS